MKLYDAQTNELVDLPDDQVSQAISSGTHGVDAAQKYVVKDQDNNTFEVSGNELRDTLSQGYTFMTPRQQEIRGYVNDNKGLVGAAKTFVGQAVDEALLGVPELAYDLSTDPEQDLARAKKDALKDDHQLANALGGITGFAGSVVGTGGLSLPARALAKGATKAGSAAAKVIASRLAKQGVAEGTAKIVAKPLAASLLEGAAKYGAEGAVWSLPTAITEATLGDPQLAAETMMYGIGFGSALGMTGAIANQSGKAFSRKVIQPITGKADEIKSKQLMRNITKNEVDYRNAKTGIERAKLLDDRVDLMNAQNKAMGLPNLDEKQMLNVYNSVWKGAQKGDDLKPLFDSLAPDKAELLLNKFDSVFNTAKSYLASSVESGATAFGASQAGPAGAVVGQQLGKKAANYINSIKDASLVDGVLFVEKQMKQVAKKLDSIGSSILAPTKDKALVGFTSSRFGSDDTPRTKKERLEEFSNIQTQVSELKSNIGSLDDKLSPVLNTLQVTGASNIASQFLAANQNAVDYLAKNMPKNPRNDLMFKSSNKWQPSDAELNTFERKYRAVIDPFSVVDDLNKGTLRRESVDAVQAVYPVLMNQIKSRVLEAVQGKEVPYQKRLKLSLLLGLPLGIEMSPEGVSYLQSNFATDAQEQESKNTIGSGKEINMPSSSSDFSKVGTVK